MNHSYLLRQRFKYVVVIFKDQFYRLAENPASLVGLIFTFPLLLKIIKKITGYCKSQLFYIRNALKNLNQSCSSMSVKNDCTSTSRVPDKNSGFF